MAKSKRKPSKAAKKRMPNADNAEQEIFDLPKREAMSLLPSGLGSLTGGAGLGGSLLGGSGTTTPAAVPPTGQDSPLAGAPSLAPPRLSPDTLTGSGADQTAPIAQQSSTT